MALLLAAPAAAMFPSENPKRLNFKLAVLADGPELAEAVLRAAHARAAKVDREKVAEIAIEGGGLLLSTAVSAPRLPSVDGYQPRLHLFAARAPNATTDTQVLRNLDGLLVAVRCDEGHACDVRPALERARRVVPLADVPVVVEVVSLEGAQTLRARQLEALSAATFTARAVKGEGIDTLARLVLEAYRARGADPAADVKRVAAQPLMQRTQALADLYRRAGAAGAISLPGRGEGALIHVFTFPPTETRRATTFASLVSEQPEQLIAHLPAHDDAVAPLLAELIREGPVKPFTVRSHAGRAYLLVPARAWPPAPVPETSFLQVVPLTAAEAERARRDGGRSLDLAKRDLTYGWAR